MAAQGNSDSTLTDAGFAASNVQWHHPDGVLDRWSERDWNRGVQLEDLEDLDTILVTTENTPYEITVLSRHTGEILVRGGRFFSERTPAHLAGSSLGGSFLKIRGIYVGYCLEFQFGRRRIVTSPIQSIRQVVE